MAYTIGALLVTSYIISKNWLLSNLLALSITLLMFRVYFCFDFIRLLKLIVLKLDAYY